MTAIAFDDYLSDDRKVEIAETAFRDICQESFRKDAERIFSNAAHRAVWAVVDGMFNGEAAERVAEKVPAIIDNLSEHTVFRQRNAWEREDSPGQIALKAAVERHKGDIGSRVAYLVEEITKQDVIDLLLNSDITLKISSE